MYLAIAIGCVVGSLVLRRWLGRKDRRRVQRVIEADRRRADRRRTTGKVQFVDKWTLVLRDQAGVELRINIDATVEAMPGGTNLNMNDMQYLGIFSESLGADVCGVTVPSEQQVIEYFGDMFNDRDERANKRLNGHTRPQDNFRDLGN